MDRKALGVGALLAVLLFAARPRKAKAAVPSDPCTNLVHFTVNTPAIIVAAAQAIADGWRSHDNVVLAVLRTQYPVYPGTMTPITWPEANDAMPDDMLVEADCVYEAVYAIVGSYLDDRGIPPWPSCPEGHVLDAKLGQCVYQEAAPTGPVPFPQEDEPEPLPPIDWDTIESKGDFPDPGTLLQVRFGDIFLGTFNPARKSKPLGSNGKCPSGYYKSGNECKPDRSIVYTTLLSAGWMAGVEFGGLDPDEPGIGEAERQNRLAQLNAFATKVASDTGNRMDYLHLIYCSPWNDAIYGTYGYSSETQMGSAPHGRAIRLLPQNENNRERLFLNKPVKRRIKLGTPANRGDGSGTGSYGSLPFIWLPMINLQILWQSGGTIITTEGVTWEDGSNAIVPPPEVMARGVENVPGKVMWGCLGYETEDVPAPRT